MSFIMKPFIHQIMHLITVWDNKEPNEVVLKKLHLISDFKDTKSSNEIPNSKIPKKSMYDSTGFIYN